MSEQKYLKYFVFDDKKDLKLPSYRLNTDSKKIIKMTHVDADTVEGGTFYNEMMWILPGFGENYTGKNPNFKEEHTHEFGELMCFYGLNYDDIMDLGAEIEFTIDGETHIITKSFTSYIPAGIEHGPLIIRNVQYPIVYFIAGPTDKYK